jgi:hypothetical protein
MPLEVYKSLDELLAIKALEDEEMFPLEWDPHVLRMCLTCPSTRGTMVILLGE